MYVKKMCGYVISVDMPYALTKGLLDSYSPPTQESRNYKNWITVLDLKTCLECRECHGQIYRMDEVPDTEPPLHPNCRCVIRPMDAVVAGYGTKDGQYGADYWMKYIASLPDYYITRDELLSLGWKKGKSPAKFAPGKMLTKGIYKNQDHHYPKFQDEFGMRRTLTITAGGETGIACYGQTTDCCLSPTIIMKHF